MMKFTFPKERILFSLSCIVIISMCALVESKPLESIQTNDPILALPSEQQSYTDGHLQQPAYTNPISYQLQYQSVPSYPQLQPVAASSGEQPISEPKQEVYYTARPENQLYIDRTGKTHGPHCTHRHEYVSISEINSAPTSYQEGAEATKHEYPGEIIYVSQDGHPIKVTGETQDERYPDMAKMVSDASGLPATILTEVPARDMPDQVLDRLKKDYGVKVVATREYPGANLVINCDEDSSQSTSICAKSLALTENMSNPPYLSHTSPADENNEPAELADEQPRMPSEQPSYAIDTSGNRAPLENGFGLRTSSEHGASTHYERQESAQAEKAEVHPDSESGFDVQASASEKVDSNQNKSQPSRSIPWIPMKENQR